MLETPTIFLHKELNQMVDAERSAIDAIRSELILAWRTLADLLETLSKDRP